MVAQLTFKWLHKYFESSGDYVSILARSLSGPILYLTVKLDFLVNLETYCVCILSYLQH